MTQVARLQPLQSGPGIFDIEDFLEPKAEPIAFRSKVELVIHSDRRVVAEFAVLKMCSLRASAAMLAVARW